MRFVYLFMEMPVWKQVQVLLMVAVYLVVVLTHIFFVAKASSSASKSHLSYNSIFKRKLESATALSLNYLERTDKSETPKPQDVEKLFTRMGAFFILLFFIGNILPFMQRFRISNLSNHQASPLPIFSLRI